MPFVVITACLALHFESTEPRMLSLDLRKQSCELLEAHDRIDVIALGSVILRRLSPAASCASTPALAKLRHERSLQDPQQDYQKRNSSKEHDMMLTYSLRVVILALVSDVALQSL